mmetsp:Transcript_11089/g.30637  ORF Transcript_11089/g.30637 Transcript_11089/m.30637 type:complete len:389 (+) Transcript_11089:13-1179(+)
MDKPVCLHRKVSLLHHYCNYQTKHGQSLRFRNDLAHALHNLRAPHHRTTPIRMQLIRHIPQGLRFRIAKDRRRIKILHVVLRRGVTLQSPIHRVDHRCELGVARNDRIDDNARVGLQFTQPFDDGDVAGRGCLGGAAFSTQVVGSDQDPEHLGLQTLQLVVIETVQEIGARIPRNPQRNTINCTATGLGKQVFKDLGILLAPAKRKMHGRPQPMLRDGIAQQNDIDLTQSLLGLQGDTFHGIEGDIPLLDPILTFSADGGIDALACFAIGTQSQLRIRSERCHELCDALAELLLFAGLNCGRSRHSIDIMQGSRGEHTADDDQHHRTHEYQTTLFALLVHSTIIISFKSHVMRLAVSILLAASAELIHRWRAGCTESVAASACYAAQC